MKSFFRISLLSFASSLLFIVCGELFDAPYSPGFFCFDVFLVFALFCCRLSLWNVALLNAIGLGFFFFANASYHSATILYYILLVWLSFAVSHLSKLRSSVIIALLLFVFVSGWSLFFEYAFSMSLGELWGIAKFFWWGVVFFVLVPVLQVAMVVYLGRQFVFKSVRPLNLVFVLISVMLLLGLHVFSENVQKRQPILDFPVYEFFKQQLQPGRITQSAILREDVKGVFPVANDLLDSIGLGEIRPTVMILIESWGVRKEFQLNLDEFSIFDSNKSSFKGIWRRQANFTQGAEYEDFCMPQGIRSGETLMEKYHGTGFETWYVHGYDGKFYERNIIYDSLGFDHTKFRDDFSEYGLVSCVDYGFEGICDSSLAGYIDSLLTDSVPKFIYWTTLDSHPPFETQKRPDDEICEDLNDVECIHAVRIRNTLKEISLLAEKHPEYRFVLRGDHRPMGSLTSSDFVTSFYHCWVPMVILN